MNEHDARKPIIPAAASDNAATGPERPDAAATRLRELEAENARLRQAVDACQQGHEEMHMAQVILSHSPAFLFRRLVGEDPPRLVYASPNIAKIGYTPEELKSGRVHFKDIIHPDDLERVVREIQEYAERKLDAFTQSYRIVTRDGRVRWVEDQTSVEIDPRDGQRYHQGIIIDITRRRQAEDALRKSEEKFRRIVETAGEGFMLMDVDLCIVDVNAALLRLLGYTREEALGQTPLAFAAEEFRNIMLAHREVLLDRDYLRTEGVLLAKDGRRVPVLAHGSALRDDSGRVIGHMAFITDMTDHKRAMALASEVQKSLLPRRAPAVQGLDVAGRNRSCDEIGGDYFDFIWRQGVPAQSLSLVVGDIAGHGVGAALLMTTARAFLRMRATQPGGLTDIVGALNRHLTEDVFETGAFMTLLLLTADLETDCLEWVRAGHDPALLYDPSQDRFTELMGPGLALGVDCQAAYPVSTCCGFKTDQLLAVGTDGIWEARNRQGVMFGKERFKNLLRRHHHESADDILEAVFQALEVHTRGVRTEDDITLVVVKRTSD
jgi:sigma-B regulation protein RsbU (phosphoserine phosphatase)